MNESRENCSKSLGIGAESTIASERNAAAESELGDENSVKKNVGDKASNEGRFNVRTRVILILALLGIGQFLVFSTLAMQVYPGGSPFDHFAEGYSFSKNPLSDLGQEYSWNRKDNRRALLIYAPSLIVVGSSAIVLFLTFPNCLKGNRFLKRVGAFFGVISGTSLVGLACTPYDRLIQIHEFFLFMWLFPFILLVLCFILGTLSSKQVSWWLRLYSFALLLVITTYTLMSIFRFGIEYYVSFQKYVVYGGVVWMFLVGVVAYRSREMRQPRRFSGLATLLVGWGVLAGLIGIWSTTDLAKSSMFGSRNDPRVHQLVFVIDETPHLVYMINGDCRNLEQVQFNIYSIEDKSLSEPIKLRVNWKDGKWVGNISPMPNPELQKDHLDETPSSPSLDISFRVISDGEEFHVGSIRMPEISTKFYFVQPYPWRELEERIQVTMGGLYLFFNPEDSPSSVAKESNGQHLMITVQRVGLGK